MKAGAAGATALSFDLPAVLAAADKKIPVGLQLYSVRQDCEKDLPKVIKTVAQIGYKGVEFAGYYNRKAAELRQLLDDHGLVCCGTHTPWRRSSRPTSRPPSSSTAPWATSI